MNLRLPVGGTGLKAATLDSETSRDFISLLPLALTLTLNDYARTDEVSDLPRRWRRQVRREAPTPAVRRHRVVRAVGVTPTPAGYRLWTAVQ